MDWFSPAIAKPFARAIILANIYAFLHRIPRRRSFAACSLARDLVHRFVNLPGALMQGICVILRRSVRSRVTNRAKNLTPWVFAFSGQTGRIDHTTTSIEEPMIPRQSETNRVPESTSSGHVLLVDDEEMLIEIGTLVLQSLGYEVTTYTDPRRALEAFSMNPDTFDLVLTDMTMPKMSGLLLAKTIRSLSSRTPIIISTGCTDNCSEEQACAAGVNRLLLKPFSKKELAIAIREALNQ